MFVFTVKVLSVQHICGCPSFAKRLFFAAPAFVGLLFITYFCIGTESGVR